MQGPALGFDAWLRLREPADASARAPGLVDRLPAHLPADHPLAVHDLGCGSGSMARWLAPRLPGAQHWVLHDRDPELLALAAGDAPVRAADGSPVTVETRRGDITRLPDDALAGAGLVTASALLDMFTAAEVKRFVASCVAAGCPALVALSVTGEVSIEPAEPLDHELRDAFNAHQRRRTERGTLLGPDAAAAAADSFREHGCEVLIRPSPWRLGPELGDLAAAWLRGWVAAAVEQEPRLADRVASYAERRLAAITAGEVRVTVGHVDLLSLPGPSRA